MLTVASKSGGDYREKRYWWSYWIRKQEPQTQTSPAVPEHIPQPYSQYRTQEGQEWEARASRAK